MATKKEVKKAPKKVAKVATKAKRADGVVARVRALFAAAKDPTDTPAILVAAEKAGINLATCRTQLGRWRKENGIKASYRRASPEAGTKVKAATKVKAGKPKAKAAAKAKPAPVKKQMAKAEKAKPKAKAAPAAKPVPLDSDSVKAAAAKLAAPKPEIVNITDSAAA
jgi:hypothetical protein